MQRFKCTGSWPLFLRSGCPTLGAHIASFFHCKTFRRVPIRLLEHQHARMDAQRYRNLLPAPHADTTSPLLLATGVAGKARALRSNTRRQKLTRVACDACRSKKAKCDGRRPTCSRCEVDGIECQFDCEPGISRTTSLRRRNDELQQYAVQFQHLLRPMTVLPRPQAMALLDRFRALFATTGGVAVLEDPTGKSLTQLALEFPDDRFFHSPLGAYLPGARGGRDMLLDISMMYVPLAQHNTLSRYFVVTA